jgi:hypothetical protein
VFRPLSSEQYEKKALCPCVHETELKEPFTDKFRETVSYKEIQALASTQNEA